MLFPSVFRVDLPSYHEGDEQCGQAAEHDHPEEVDVADGLLYVSGHKAREHHAQGHECRADGIVGGLKLTFGEVHHVEHVGGEAKAVAELLDAKGDGDDGHVAGLCDGEVDKGEAGQRHAGGHEPQRALQSQP